MPLYNYRCNDHDHEFSQRQRMTDDPLTECPICGGPVRRVISSVGVVFKGSGFYVTDNRNGTGEAKNPAATTADGNGGDGDKSDATSSGGTSIPSDAATSEKSAAGKDSAAAPQATPAGSTAAK